MKKSKKIVASALTALAMFPMGASKVFAQSQGQAIQFGNLDNLLWSIVKTVQYYTLPLMAIALVLLGVKLLTSGDDTGAKDSIKSWIIKILIGGIVIFGAASLATLLKSAVGG